MTSRFTKWFRGLSNGQAAIFYILLVVCGLLTLWHNPTQGYERSLRSVRTDSMELALSNLKRQAVEDNSSSLSALSYDCEHYWRKRGLVPENGYFYMEKNPWWWFAGYKSKGYEPDAIPGFVRSPLRILDTLSGYMKSILVAVVLALVMIWLVGIRNPLPNSK